METTQSAEIGQHIKANGIRINPGTARINDVDMFAHWVVKLSDQEKLAMNEFLDWFIKHKDVIEQADQQQIRFYTTDRVVDFCVMQFLLRQTDFSGESLSMDRIRAGDAGFDRAWHHFPVSARERKNPDSPSQMVSFSKWILGLSEGQSLALFDFASWAEKHVRVLESGRANGIRFGVTGRVIEFLLRAIERDGVITQAAMNLVPMPDKAPVSQAKMH